MHTETLLVFVLLLVMPLLQSFGSDVLSVCMSSFPHQGAILAHNLGLDRTNSRIHSYTETDSVDYQQDKSFRLSDNHKKEKSCTCR